MSLRTVYAFIATLAILLVWSFVSTLLLYKEAEVADYRQERITDLLSTIFSYQQRYDAIYERSYPTAPKTVAGTLDKISKEAEAFGTAELLSVAKAEAKTKAGATQALAVKNPKVPAAAPTTAPAKPSDSQAAQKSAALAQLKTVAATTATVEKPFAAVLEAISATAKDQKSVEVAFSIRNNMKPKRAIGYVFAKATFEVDGKEVIRTAPAGLNFADVNKPIRARGYKFSIRSFTRKNITLNYPSGTHAKLTNLELLMWSKTKREKVYPLAMTKVKLIKELVKAKPAPRVKPTSLLPTKDPFPAADTPSQAGAAPISASRASEDNKPVPADFPVNDPFQSPELKGVAEEPSPDTAPSASTKGEAKPKELAKDIVPPAER